MSGTVAASGLIAGMLSLTLMASAGGAALTQRQSLHGAADAAALAAADTLFGFATGNPCERADVVAQSVGARVTQCEVDETSVTITVARRILAVMAQSSARAGVE